MREPIVVEWEEWKASRAMKREALRRAGLDAPSRRKNPVGTSDLRLRRAFGNSRVPNWVEQVTDEVAFARVMGKYERAKELGVLAATNQIAALNKRLSDFQKEAAEAKRKDDQAKENDRRAKEVLGDVAPASHL